MNGVLRVVLAVGVSISAVKAKSDPTFVPDLTGTTGGIRSVAAFADGVAVGLGGPPYLVRLDRAGKKREGFEVIPPLSETPEILRAFPNGDLLVVTRSQIIRLDSNGRVDESFEDPIGASRNVYDARIDGGIWLTGSILDPRTQETTGVLRLTDSGAIDPTFESPVTSFVWRVLPIASQNAVYVSGQFEQDPETRRHRRFRRLNWNGELDTDFGPVADAEGYLLTHAGAGGTFDANSGGALAVDRNGRLWIAAGVILGDAVAGMTVVEPNGEFWVTDWLHRSNSIQHMVPRSSAREETPLRMDLFGRMYSLMGRPRPLAGALTWRQASLVWKAELDSAIDLRPVFDDPVGGLFEDVSARPAREWIPTWRLGRPTDTD